MELYTLDSHLPQSSEVWRGRRIKCHSIPSEARWLWSAGSRSSSWRCFDISLFAPTKLLQLSETSNDLPDHLVIEGTQCVTHGKGRVLFSQLINTPFLYSDHSSSVLLSCESLLLFLLRTQSSMGILLPLKFRGNAGNFCIWCGNLVVIHSKLC